MIGAVKAVGAAMVKPHKAALSNLARIPLTLLGTGCIDAGVIHANLTAGLIVTGLSLLVVEHIVADE